MAQTSAPGAALASLDDAFDQGDIDRIQAELTALEAAHPTDVRVRTFRARLTAAEGNLDAALASLRELVRQNPTVSEPEAYLGALLVARREYEQGIRHLDRAISAGAEIPAANHAMGVALAAGEQYREAIVFLALAADAMPGSASTFFYMGICHAELGELEEADEAFTVSLQLEPRQAEAWELLARARAEAKKPNEALAAINDGLDQVPGNGRLLRLRAQLLLDFGRRDLVRDAVLAIPEGDRTDEDEVTLAVAAVEARDVAEALVHARRAVELGPGNWNAHYVLGTVLEGQEPIDFAAVIAAYERAIELGDPEGRAGTRLGFVLAEDRPGADVERAIQVLEAARARSQDDPGTLLTLALSYARADRKNLVAPLCQLILQRDDASPSVREQAERLTRTVR